jgi:hypothetical protein
MAPSRKYSSALLPALTAWRTLSQAGQTQAQAKPVSERSSIDTWVALRVAARTAHAMSVPLRSDHSWPDE